LFGYYEIHYIFAMVIITKGVVHEFAKKHPSAAIPLNDWFEKTSGASWKNFTEIRSTFNTVDAIGEDRYVFDIAGNNFRLIAMIHFNIRTLYIRAILTHKEYDILSKARKLTEL
jgi:mRNA interferase HigB